jgi:hypothetical protein
MTDLDTRYVATKSLTEYFVNKTTGFPITGGAIKFWQDDNRSQPKLVYQLTGSPPNYQFTALPNPMAISVGSPMNGDFPAENTTIYYYPYDEDGDVQLYYIQIYDEDGILQKELQAWPPGIADGTQPIDVGNFINNQISNSQFVTVDFEDDFGVEIELSGPTSGLEAQIGPDWFLRISSNDAGSVIVNRTLLAGSLNIETNPPYRLDILPTGGTITSLQLVQRLTNNPDIWATQFLSGGMLITSLDGNDHTVIMSYAPNIAPSPTVIAAGETDVAGYVYVSDTVEIDPGVNTDGPDTGYVDIIITLPVNGGVGVTSVQVAGMDVDQSLTYEQEPVNRQKDHLAHYYLPLVQAVPVPSLSVGWDFRVNPAQFGATQGASTLASRYIWDQTIVWQGASNLITAQRTSNKSRLRIILTTTGQFALVQYLESYEMRQLLTNQFSMIIDAFSDIAGGVAGTASVWVTSDANLPNVASPAGLSLISTLDANGKPATFNGNWTEIPRNYRGDARFNIPYSADNLSTKTALEGWNRVDNSTLTNATFCAIVIGFSSSIAGDVGFESISVTPGPLAVPFAPMSYDATLYNLQRYYEKSYGEDVYGGDLTTSNSLNFLMQNTLNTTLYAAYPGMFNIIWKSQKRSASGIVTLYSPTTGASTNVRAVVLSGGSAIYDANLAASNWTVNGGVNAIYYIQNNTTVFYSETPVTHVGLQSLIQLHYTNDSRLGIV